MTRPVFLLFLPQFFLATIVLECRAQPEDSSIRIQMDEQVFIDFTWVDSLKIWMGQYEVTNRQYRKFMRFRDGSHIDGLELNGDEQPAVFVSYCDALGFCHWLNTNAELPEGYEARLPTGKEWSYCVKAGTDRKFPWGDTWPPRAGNYLDESGFRELDWEWYIEQYWDGFAVSAPVPETYRNELGIYGMGGNVREWTSETDEDSTRHLIRGGSWRDSKKATLSCNSSVAGAMWGRDNHIGFRVVLGSIR